MSSIESAGLCSRAILIADSPSLASRSGKLSGNLLLRRSLKYLRWASLSSAISMDINGSRRRDYIRIRPASILDFPLLSKEGGLGRRVNVVFHTDRDSPGRGRLTMLACMTMLRGLYN